MNETKLITILRDLTVNEWSSCRKHLMKYTDKDTDVYSIFEYFQKNKHNLDNLADSENIVRKHFPHLTPKVFINYMSILYQWIEEWLVIEEIKEESFQYDLTLYKAMTRRGMYTLADQIEKKIKDTSMEQSGLFIEKDFTLYQLMHYYYYSENKSNIDKAKNFNLLVNHFVKYMVHISLVYQAEYINSKIVLQNDHSLSELLFTNLNNFTQGFKGTTFYKSLYNLIEKNTEASISTLFKEVKSGRIEKESSYFKLMYIYLIAYATKAWAKNNIKDTSLLFNIFNSALEEDVLATKGKIDESLFTTMLSAIAEINTYDEVKTFIDQWITKVETKNMQAKKDLAYAINALHHQKYEEISQHVLRSDFSNIVDKLRANSLYLIYLFETKADRDFFSQYLKNFTSQLERNKNKIGVGFYDRLNNFIKVIKLLTEHHTQIDLSKYSPLIYKLWISRQEGIKV